MTQLLRMLVLFCSVLGPTASIAQTRLSPDLSNTPLERFESYGQSALQTLLRFGFETKLPLGLVLANDALCKTTVTVAVPGQPAASMLDELMTEIPEYGWSLRNGVVIAQPKNTPSTTTQFLHIVLPRFVAPQGPLRAQQAFLSMFVKAVFKPSEGTMLNVATSPAERELPALQMKQATVEEALSRLVSRKPGGIWILFPIPDDLSKTSDHPFAAVFSYADDASKIAEVSCSSAKEPSGEPSNPH